MTNNKRLKKIPKQYQGKVRRLMADLIDAIIAERKRQNLSQEEFSVRINLSVKCLQAYEQGSRKPSFETLLVMFVALDIPLKIS